MVDTGFIGIRKFHKNSELPNKEKKNIRLTIRIKLQIVQFQAVELLTNTLLVSLNSLKSFRRYIATVENALD